MAVNLVPGFSVDVTGDFNLSDDNSFTLVPGSPRKVGLNQTQLLGFPAFPLYKQVVVFDQCSEMKSPLS